MLMMAGALCYAELGSAYPHQGGEYHYLTRAWGSKVGFIFTWSRGMMVQTGAIAAAAFIYGDYAAAVVPLDKHAALAIVATTALNMTGTRESINVQHVFTACTLLAVGAVVAGLASPEAAVAPLKEAAAPVVAASPAEAWAMGLTLMLLTYGGWNEAAYLSGELDDPARNVSRVLLIDTGRWWPATSWPT